MEKEAAEAGFYESPHLEEKFPRIQILTIAQLLVGEQVALPASGSTPPSSKLRSRKAHRRNR